MVRGRSSRGSMLQIYHRSNSGPGRPVQRATEEYVHPPQYCHRGRAEHAEKGRTARLLSAYSAYFAVKLCRFLLGLSGSMGLG
jgi:hypothetical protein